jgi:hypothetical protein
VAFSPLCSVPISGVANWLVGNGTNIRWFARWEAARLWISRRLSPVYLRSICVLRGVPGRFWRECGRHNGRVRTSAGVRAWNRRRRWPCSRDSRNDAFACVAIVLRTGQLRPGRSSPRPPRSWDGATGLRLPRDPVRGQERNLWRCD